MAPSAPRLLQRMLSLDDFEDAARRALPRPVFGYLSGAAENGHTIAANRSAFDAYAFRPQALVDITKRSTRTELFGISYAAPFGLAPMGLCALMAYRGDVAMAQAAAKAGVPMVLSGASLIPLEDVAQAHPGIWFQAYLPGDAQAIEALTARLARTTIQTLVLTVDMPVAANREQSIRAGFSIPLRPSLSLAWQGVAHPGWLLRTFAKTLWRHGMPHFENTYAGRGGPILSAATAQAMVNRGGLTWDHVALMRRLWKGQLVLKGILRAEDARQAEALGMDGLIVSNHGGRQLDGTMASLHALPAIVATVQIPVMVDGGFRRGTDVLKALALGARFVFLGRPFAYSAAVAGEAGVSHAIALLQQELFRNLGMLGMNHIAALRAGNHLVQAGPPVVPSCFPSPSSPPPRETSMSTTVWHKPFAHPQAWTRASMQSDPSWRQRLTPQDQREIATALAHAMRAGKPMLQWQQTDFPLDTLATRLQAVAREIRDGRGITLLEGLDIGAYTDEEVCMLYWGIGLYLGEPLGQNPKGDLLGHVFDQGRNYGDIDVRGYETSAYLPYHTDSANLVGLMCLRQGLSGGRSSYVSAVSIYNSILAEHPEYLGMLYNGFHYIRREEALGAKGVTETPLPIFGQQDGVLSCRYIRNQINAGAVKRGVPLTPMELEVLDYFDAQTQREDLRVDFQMNPGDMAFCNNLTMLHSRTGFVDGPEHHQKRHMLRLWLQFPERWPSSPLFGDHRNHVLHERTVVSTSTTLTTLATPTTTVSA